jgi:hypothetical protein
MNTSIAISIKTSATVFNYGTSHLITFMTLAELQQVNVLNLVTVRNLVIVDYFLLTIDNLYIHVYLYTDMFCILWVTTPFGSTEHEIN